MAWWQESDVGMHNRDVGKSFKVNRKLGRRDLTRKLTDDTMHDKSTTGRAAYGITFPSTTTTIILDHREHPIIMRQKCNEHFPQLSNPGQLKV
jgi:hypothetical protein